MRVQFNTHLALAGIGLEPWPRAGLERWFKDYTIASLHGWDLGGVPGAPPVKALEDSAYGMPALRYPDSQSLMETPQFQRLLLEQLPGRILLTYKAFNVPERLQNSGLTFLGADKRITRQLENKADFRRLFARSIPFPPFTVVERAGLEVSERGLDKLRAGREATVLQDEVLSGGRGTFVVRTMDDLQAALKLLNELPAGRQLVVSDYIAPAHDRSVQAVVTRYGTFVGPLQKQLVGDDLLANAAVPSSDRFCGAEISPEDVCAGAYEEIRGHALAIGERLQSLGYRGIFSVDCLVDNAGSVFVLEINPRITGVTPLLTMTYREGRDIPFLLLHTLELAGVDYTIEDDFADPQRPEASFFVLHSPWTRPMQVMDSLPSGSYSLSMREFLGKQYRFDPNQQGRLLLQQCTGKHIQPTETLLRGFVPGRMLDDSDNLLPDIRNTIEWLLNNTEAKEGVIT